MARPLVAVAEKTWDPIETCDGLVEVSEAPWLTSRDPMAYSIFRCDRRWKTSDHHPSCSILWFLRVTGFAIKQHEQNRHFPLQTPCSLRRGKRDQPSIRSAGLTPRGSREATAPKELQRQRAESPARHEPRRAADEVPANNRPLLRPDSIVHLSVVWCVVLYGLVTQNEFRGGHHPLEST